MTIVLTDTARDLLDTKKRCLPTPLIYRQANNNKLAIFLPDARMSNTIQAWCGGGKKVRYNPELGAYIVLSKYLRQVSDGVASRYNKVRVVLDHQPTERCDTRCQEAQGEDCNCQCLGRNHGGNGYLNDWYHVGDTTLIRYDGIIRSKYIVTKEEHQMPDPGEFYDGSDPEYNALIDSHTCGSVDWENGKPCLQCIQDGQEPCAKCNQLATLLCTDENGADFFCDKCHADKLDRGIQANQIEENWKNDNIWKGCSDQILLDTLSA